MYNHSLATKQGEVTLSSIEFLDELEHFAFSCIQSCTVYLKTFKAFLAFINRRTQSAKNGFMYFFYLLKVAITTYTANYSNLRLFPKASGLSLNNKQIAVCNVKTAGGTIWTPKRGKIYKQKNPQKTDVHEIKII